MSVCIDSLPRLVQLFLTNYYQTICKLRRLCFMLIIVTVIIGHITDLVRPFVRLSVSLSVRLFHTGS